MYVCILMLKIHKNSQKFKSENRALGAYPVIFGCVHWVYDLKYGKIMKRRKYLQLQHFIQHFRSSRIVG